MKIVRYTPYAALRPFIKSLQIIESDERMVNTILPHTSIVVAFRLRGTVALVEDGIESGLSSVEITGLRKSSFQIAFSKRAATLLVEFTEGGTVPFFDKPLHELFGLTVPLDHFIPRNKLKEIEERLSAATANSDRFGIVEGFLSAELTEARTDVLVGKAVHEIKLAKGNVRIRELADSLHISQDAFEKRFRRLIGASPKQFSRIVRFRSVIEDYRLAKNLTEAAVSADYFDQAHFTKDFKSFTGQTPREFFKSLAPW